MPYHSEHSYCPSQLFLHRIITRPSLIIFGDSSNIHYKIFSPQSLGVEELKTILLADVFNLYNRGERLSVNTIIKHLPADYGYLSLYSIVDPRFFEERKNRIELVGKANMLSAPVLMLYCLLQYFRAWLYHVTDNEGFLNDFLKKIKTYDLAVDLGGETFQDQYNLFGMLKHLYTLKLLILLHVKYSIISHTIIFKNTFCWRLSKPILKNADALTIRNLDSYKFLVKNGVQGYMIPDIAFAFNKIKRMYIKSKPKIGVNASPFVKRHINAYVCLLEALVAEGYNVNLIPHVIFDSKRDDRPILFKIWRKLRKETQQKVSIYLGCNFETIKELIDKCNIWVGSRFHSVIYAIGRGIPSINVGYSDKSHCLKRLLGQNITIVDAESPTFTRDIMEKIFEITIFYADYMEKFQQDLRKIKKESMKHIEVLRGIL